MQLTRLADLRPIWHTTGDGRHGMALSFDCPHCPLGRRLRLTIHLANPLDGRPADPGIPQNLLWQRTGGTFDKLTLEPMICFQTHCGLTVANGVVQIS